jgi:purine-binding chemotaxis protein CheW
MTTDALASAATLVDAMTAADRRFDVLISPTATPARGAAKDVTDGARYVLLSIASAHYAVLETFVTELERVPKTTPVPGVPAWVRGVTNLRGDILSVIDMRTFLGLDPAPLHSARMLVVRLLDEDFSAGLLVDAVDRIVAVSPDDIRSPESRLDGPLAEYLTGVSVIGDRVVAVLDLDRLLRSSNFRQFEEPRDIEAAATVTTTIDRDAIEGRAGTQKD